MTDLAAAGVASIETLAFPLKPRSGPAADAWPAVAARDLNTLHTRLVRGGVTLVPMMAAARARAFPEEAAARPGAGAAARGAARSVEGRVGEAASRRRRESEARLDEPGRVPEAFRRRPRAGGGGFGIRTGRLPGAWRRPPPRTRRPRARGSAPIEAIRAATSTRPISSARSPPWSRFAPGTDANFIIVSGDPLKKIEDLADITHVIRAGEVFEPKAAARAGLRLLIGRSWTGQRDPEAVGPPGGPSSE